jgi:hypothetical protein
MKITKRDWANFMTSEYELQWASNFTEFSKAIRKQNKVLAALLKDNS